MKNENKLSQKISEYNSNTQLKSTIALIFWILFFLVAILFVRSLNTKEPEKREIKKNNMNSYEYTYYDNNNTIIGKTYNNKHLFTISDHKYYYDSKNTYEIKDYKTTLIPEIDINYLRITPNMIDNLTSKINYTKENEALVYNVPLSNFINLYEKDVPVNTQEADKYNIRIYKYIKDNKLYMIKIDLSSYYEFISEENKGILTIEIYEQNRINDFTKEYDGMIGVRE